MTSTRCTASVMLLEKKMLCFGLCIRRGKLFWRGSLLVASLLTVWSYYTTRCSTWHNTADFHRTTMSCMKFAKLGVKHARTLKPLMRVLKTIFVSERRMIDWLCGCTRRCSCYLFTQPRTDDGFIADASSSWAGRFKFRL